MDFNNIICLCHKNGNDTIFFCIGNPLSYKCLQYMQIFCSYWVFCRHLITVKQINIWSVNNGVFIQFLANSSTLRGKLRLKIK